MQTHSTKANGIAGGHSRDGLLQEAGNVHDLADPLRSARLHPMGGPRYEEASLFLDVVAYLEPILKIVFQSHEIELARRSMQTAAGEISLRYVLRPDGTVIKYDQANNSDIASPLEFLREEGDLAAVLDTLFRALWAEKTPLATAAADEVRIICDALGR